MTREKAIKEFAALFEQASIPVLNVKPTPPKRIAVVLKGSPLDKSARAVADHLATRFDADVKTYCPAGADATSKTPNTAGAKGTAFSSTTELIGQLSIHRSQLVVLPVSEDESQRHVELDALVEGATPPVLILRTPVADPASVFSNVLHSLTGNFEQSQNFANSFALVENGGSMLLLHTIAEQEIDDVRDALRVAPVDDNEQQKLLDAMTHRGERYLKAIVAAGREMPFDVSYQLRVGLVVEQVEAELARKRYGLLVVGRRLEGHSHVAADDYQLMHSALGVAVLAL